MKIKNNFNEDFVNSKKINNKFLPSIKKVFNNPFDISWKDDLFRNNDYKINKKSRKHIPFTRYLNRNTEDPKNENDLNNSYFNSHIL